ncbi:MAG: truncated hemoglobin [Bradymonadaceae bacterium]
MSDSSESIPLTDAVGGLEELRAIVDDFYARVFEDPIIGFMFDEVDRGRIVDAQVEYLRAKVGEADVEYEGEPIRAAHRDLPITVGHFDRRHALLVETLEDWDVPEPARERWIEFDAALRDLVIETGEQAREEMLSDGGSEGE